MQPRLSPDGSRLALQLGSTQDSDIWVFDFARETLTPLTFGLGLDAFPVWMPPDGRRIVFTSQAEASGFGRLFWRTADGAGSAERLGQESPIPPLMLATSVSPDGRRIVTSTVVGISDVMMLTLEDGRVRPLVQTPSVETNGAVSPDGRWLAYESNANASAQFQIYVRPFPDGNGGPWQVSSEGGTQPAWARGGRELFYLAPDGTLSSVPVERGTTWTPGTPRKLLDKPYFRLGYTAGVSAGRNYDVSADGQRFLMIKEAGRDLPDAPASIVVVQNWIEELKRLMPAK
jgi:serine/threonine-protein kinase